LLLFVPRGFYVVQMAWTEPYLVLVVAAGAFAALRVPRVAPYLLGVALAAKQYLVLTLPLLVLLPGPRRPVLVRATIAAAVVVVPFFVAGPGAFVHSVAEVHLRQPFRHDALSYLVLAAGDGTLPAVLGLVPVALVAALVARRTPRSLGGYLVAAAAVLIVFFAFATQAFCNYYFGVFGIACVAIAALA
jgi:hypothetical protein